MLSCPVMYSYFCHFLSFMLQEGQWGHGKEVLSLIKYLLRALLLIPFFLAVSDDTMHLATRLNKIAFGSMPLPWKGHCIPH